MNGPEGAEKIQVEILTRTKDEAENKRLFERIIEVVGEGVSNLVFLIVQSRNTDDFRRRTRLERCQRIR